MWKIKLAIIWGQWRHAQLIGLHWAILKHNHLLVLLFLSQVPQHPVCRDVQLERNLLHFVSVISVISALSSHLEYCRFCVTRLAPSCQKSKLILQFPVILVLIKSHPDSKSQRILPDLTIGAKKTELNYFFLSSGRNVRTREALLLVPVQVASAFAAHVSFYFKKTFALTFLE